MKHGLPFLVVLLVILSLPSHAKDFLRLVFILVGGMCPEIQAFSSAIPSQRC
jgi:hypothetical protein